MGGAGFFLFFFFFFSQIEGQVQGGRPLDPESSPASVSESVK